MANFNFIYLLNFKTLSAKALLAMFIPVANLTKTTSTAFIAGVWLFLGVWAQMIVQLVDVEEHLVAVIIFALVKVLSASWIVDELVDNIILAFWEVAYKFDRRALKILSVDYLDLIVSLYVKLIHQLLDEV